MFTKDATSITALIKNKRPATGPDATSPLRVVIIINTESAITTDEKYLM